MDGQPPADREARSSRLGPVLFAVAICGPLFYVYGHSNEAETLRDCVRRGPPDSTAVTPLQQAQQLGSCVERQANPIGQLFFQPTLKMLHSLPNAPSRWQGVWVSEEYGNAYEYHLCADSRIRVRPAADPTADDSWVGSWGVHENTMIWLRNDRGPVLPALSQTIQGDESGRFSLVGPQGEIQAFERQGSNPSCRPAA